MNKKLITWQNRYEKLNKNAETDFLNQCGKNGHTGLFGTSRFFEFVRMMKLFPAEPRAILDVGGTEGTAKWLSAKFPKSKVTILNLSEKEIGNWPDFIKGDGTNFDFRNKFNLIFLGEFLEHAYNPDGTIASSILSLKLGGHIFISTPNLASFYNRIFLLFGWSLSGYYPSLRYMTGNPFFKNNTGIFGDIMDHKSVFTWKGLTGLLKIYKLKIIISQGCDVTECDKSQKLATSDYKTLGGGVRPILNRILPKSARVGMLFLCQKETNSKASELKNAILRKNLWDI